MVYVDYSMACIPNSKWKRSKVCHLIADTEDEVHIFAASISLKRKWYQTGGRLPHYDLTESKRKEAISKGAIYLRRRDFVEKANYIIKSIKEGS